MTTEGVTDVVTATIMGAEATVGMLTQGAFEVTIQEITSPLAG
jgi:hypothetical protein